MLEQLEQYDVWQTLRRCPDPLILYGMGNGAEKILQHLKAESGRTVEAVFASDAFVRGHSFLGYPVQHYHSICEQYKTFTIILGFGFHDDQMRQRIWEINQEHPVLAPDVPIAGDGLFTRKFAQAHEEELAFVYRNLADERSRQVYLDILNYKISGKVKYLYSSFDDKMAVYTDLLRLTRQESIVDLGAYDGDTIRECLAATGGSYQTITAVEADSKNFEKLCRKTEGMERMTRWNLGIWREKTTLAFHRKAGRNSQVGAQGLPIPADSVDHLVAHPVTFLKMDVEGAEMAALEGAAETIRRDRPKLYVCAYHRNEDLFALPKKIWELCPDYQLYFRHSPCIPAWECNFYGICPDRPGGTP